MQNRDRKIRRTRRQRGRGGTAESYEIPRVDPSVPVRAPKDWRKPYIFKDDDAKNNRVAIYCRVSTRSDEGVEPCPN